MAGVDELPMYVIYDNATDYPGEFVCRVQRVIGGQIFADRDLFARGTTLNDVRVKLPPGLYNLGRNPGDEPHIVEVWI